MHSTPPLLIAFVSDPALARVVERAMRDGWLLLVGSPPEFVEGIRREQPNGVLIDLSVAGAEVEALVPAAAAHVPKAPILLHAPPDPARLGAVADIAQCFPASVVLRGREQVARELGRFLREQLGLKVAAALVLELAEDMRAEVQWILRHCLARETARPTVAELASIVGSPVRSFGRHISSTSGMSPQDVVTLSRLLLAAAMLHVTRLSVERVAEAVGYAEASALSRAMKRHLGWRCGELREHGAFPRLVRSLRARYPRWFVR